jgi:predicted O-methyltransferase YrrM
MKKKEYLYRVCSWLKHQLTAWNTGGEGIHSPYLFEWVRMVMSDTHAYYIWSRIEGVRRKMLESDVVVNYVDYGSGSKQMCEGLRSERLVKDIANKSVSRRKKAQMLFRLVNWLGHQMRCGEKGMSIVELGTSLGVTTSYLASVDSRDRVLTYEGCEDVAKLASENWNVLGLNNIECCVGEIDIEKLRVKINEIGVDVAFVDANHTYDATLKYFGVLADGVHSKSVVVVDDIHYSAEMEEAWKAICADERVTTTMDLYDMGLVFFDKHYWHRHYRMRL